MCNFENERDIHMYRVVLKGKMRFYDRCIAVGFEVESYKPKYTNLNY